MKFFNVLLLAFLIIGVSCQAQKSEVVSEVIDVETFDQKIKTGDDEIILLDVRTPEEVQKGKIANAITFDFYGDDFESQLDGLDKSKPCLVYCGSGVRSAKTAKKLEKLGFKEIYDLRGGIKAWKRAGMPTN